MAKNTHVPLATVSFLKPEYPQRPAKQALSARSETILNEIETLPGHTVQELSDILNEPSYMIHALLLHTTLGRWLATTGKVALSKRGSRPRWFKKIPLKFRDLVPVKLTVPQLNLPQLSTDVPVHVADNWAALGEDIVRIICQNTYSPKIRRARLAMIADHISMGVAREVTALDTIKTMQIAPPAPEVRLLAKPTVTAKTKNKAKVKTEKAVAKRSSSKRVTKKAA